VKEDSAYHSVKTNFRKFQSSKVKDLKSKNWGYKTNVSDWYGKVGCK
jgi:hypothetical protein